MQRRVVPSLVLLVLACNDKAPAPPPPVVLMARDAAVEAVIDADIVEQRAKLGMPVRLSGRIVDARSKLPIGSVRLTVVHDPRGEATVTTDVAGRFTFDRVSTVPLELRGEVEGEGGYYPLTAAIDLSQATDNERELGDLLVAKMRVPDRKLGGTLGADIYFDGTRGQVKRVDPGGPAARAGLRADDVITSIDGIALASVGPDLPIFLLLGPPATSLVLGLARGTTITVTLGPPA